MILTALGKGAGAGALYPEFIGRRGLFVGIGTGPASYVAGTADPISLAIPNYYIDAVAGGVTSVSGKYVVYAQPSGTGTRQTWGLRWFIALASAGTVGQEANSANLSAEQVQLALFVGQF